MSISLIQRCSVTRWLNLTSSCSRRRQVDRLPSAHALERFEDLGLLDEPPRQRGVQRRQGESAILKHFHQLPAGAEQQHRAELRVDAAAEDQLVSFGRDHRLHADAGEMLRAGFLGSPTSRMARKASRTAASSARFSFTPPTSVLCVMVGEFSLSTTGNPISRAACDRFVLGGRKLGFHDRNAVGFQHLLRFELGEDGPARCASAFNHAQLRLAGSIASALVSAGVSYSPRRL